MWKTILPQYLIIVCVREDAAHKDEHVSQVTETFTWSVSGLTSTKTIIAALWTIPTMSWIKYDTLTSTCLYLLSLNVVPVWSYLSRQTELRGFVSASRAALRDVCLTQTPAGCCLDRIILSWTRKEISPSVWERFCSADCIWIGGAGEERPSRRVKYFIRGNTAVFVSARSVAPGD